MKIAAWNLNHRTRMKDLSQGILEVIGEIAPDVLVLTEYVDGDSRAAFKEALKVQGLLHISVSKKIEGHNQVLIASRHGHTQGSVVAPLSDSHAETNFGCIRLLDSCLEVVGIRAPAYKTETGVEAYWAALEHRLQGVTDRSVLLIGDMNGDPANPHSVGGKHLGQLRERGWTIPNPIGEWSYSFGTGSTGSRIDHVLATASIGAITASYITRVGGHVVAGANDQAPLSDHAILVVELKANGEAAISEFTASRAELIVHVAAEGGGLDLVGCRKGGGWVFRRSVRDWTPELLDEEWIEHESQTVDTWDAALDLLDRYPWHRLTPIKVHPEFRKALFDAVVSRYGSNARGAYSTFEKWETLCRS
ncbi:MAG: endonuclease/exonuclease/phosphatase family protein [Betaproteobacteria bacterium]|nr:endonuclease/exonuclease/phosphatase family protein [Betaproteobacteria bacterium]